MAVDKALAKPDDAAMAVYELPPTVEEEWPEERQVSFQETCNGPPIVIIGTWGKVFNPGMSECIRVVWQWAEKYRTTGPDTDKANASLVSVGSIPARTAYACNEKGPRLCRVITAGSKSNPGYNYYKIVAP